MRPRHLHEYHVFLASPGDVDNERREVRRFFEEYNRHTAGRWGVRFTVVDWENHSSAGVGRPQELITRQTLDKFRDSLALVVGIMGQRFGSPTGAHESGTEEEFARTLASHQQTGFPEIKWFFRNFTKFETQSTDVEEIAEALEQWKRVKAFREHLEKSDPPLFYRTFADTLHFREVLRDDLSLWLGDEARPWYVLRDRAPADAGPQPAGLSADYYRLLIQDFESLDIAGIDKERAVDIPLSEVYVRLRVIRDEDSAGDEDVDGGPIDIHTALGQYQRLVIVGDPGSGKSTFLKFIALMIARSRLEEDSGLAAAKLNLQEPLPAPFFVSLWDLSDFVRQSQNSGDDTIPDFIVRQSEERGVKLTRDELEAMLGAGNCCLLFDGLDEVPTERGRALISRLVEKFVARYEKNRFVVTSRVRGYTGDTILKGGFVRCDVQNFNESDRREFLLNWFAALLGVGREHVLDDGRPSRQAFDALQPAIESKDRIRDLAVNPLMMTVIAIVHWNRKRLPDQRVDLYDECIDVLLGQRKEAEYTTRARPAEVLSQEAERETRYDRAWKRKRFAEIALIILRSGRDEITRDVILGHLRQRFRDRPDSTDERAAHDAERFLDHEELRSGLLVSRRSQSCRFVHLTFQEYLAAWHLASLNFDEIKTTVTLHLRDPQWFETLQLLGGEIARNSDEKLDAYISHLLDQMGDTINDQAPIIALCANTLRDIKDVADVKPDTHRRFNQALTGTLHAFKPDSRVPAKTQLEVLRALAPLGARVKEHLIEATKSANFPVRSEALNMLLPHLPDNDLFGMGHILNDRSREPIIVYLSTLFNRDEGRALAFLKSQPNLSYKAIKAFLLTLKEHEDISDVDYVVELGKRFTLTHPYSMQLVLWDWNTNAPASKGSNVEEVLRRWAVEFLSKELRYTALRVLAGIHYSWGTPERSLFVYPNIDPLDPIDNEWVKLHVKFFEGQKPFRGHDEVWKLLEDVSKSLPIKLKR